MPTDTVAAVLAIQMQAILAHIERMEPGARDAILAERDRLIAASPIDHKAAVIAALRVIDEL